MATTKPRPGVTKTTGEIKENGLTIQNIVIRPVVRANKDIIDWRTSHQTAEGLTGIRVPLYDMYSDVLLDMFLKRLVAKRILAVTKNKIKYIGNDESEIAGSEILLGSQQFRKLRKCIGLSHAWGITVMELINDKGALKVFDVPRKHIRPAEGIVTVNQYDSKGIDYRSLPKVVEIGEYDDLGYLLEAAACVIYKRGVVGDWANYAQIFGMPFREYRYDGFNDAVRLQLEMAAEKAAGAAYAILPKDAEFKMHEASNAAGSNTLYDALRKAMNEEMSVGILGATETTTSSASSGYAQSQTHQLTVDEVVEDDCAEELAILNEKVGPVLQLIGLLPAGGRFAYDNPADMEKIGKKIEVATKMRGLGVPVSDDYFYEISGVPKPANYDAMIAEAAATKAAQQAAMIKPDPKEAGKPEAKQKDDKVASKKQSADF